VFTAISHAIVVVSACCETACAALKAEAPQAGPHWALAAEADARGFTASADHHDRMADRREHQRTARKAANRRRAKRGWR
jgi:hypothetical protein